MELYKNIKKFTEISPAVNNMGEYLKDATKVCEIYYEMLRIDNVDNSNDATKEAMKLNEDMIEIINRWTFNIRF